MCFFAPFVFLKKKKLKAQWQHPSVLVMDFILISQALWKKELLRQISLCNLRHFQSPENIVVVAYQTERMTGFDSLWKSNQ